MSTRGLKAAIARYLSQYDVASEIRLTFSDVGAADEAEMEAGISAVLECAPEDLQGRYALSLGASRCAEAVQPLCELLQRATSGGSGRVAAAALWGLYCLGDMRAFGCLVNSFPSLVGPSRRLCVKALSRIMASAAEVVLQGSADADDCDTAAEALAMASELLPRPEAFRRLLEAAMSFDPVSRAQLTDLFVTSLLEYSRSSAQVRDMARHVQALREAWVPQE